MSTKEIDTILESLDNIDKGMKLLSSGPRSWYFDKVRNYVKVLFNRFAPFKINDKVVLTKDYIIDPKTCWGWVGYEKMMVKGAKATVVSIDLRSDSDKFTIGIEFDNEFWIDKNSNKRFEHKDKHVFNFSEDYLVKI